MTERFSFFNFNILFSDKHNNFNIWWINIEIIEEYKIFESWLKILKEPFEEYISCIVSSVKKNPLTVKYNENDIKNRLILREGIL